MAEGKGVVVSERIRLQVELSGDPTRVWVAISPNISVRELASAVSAQYAKVRGAVVVVEDMSLRGALLDPDEKVGFWVKDQELLYATAKVVAAQSKSAARPSEQQPVVHAKAATLSGNPATHTGASNAAPGTTASAVPRQLAVSENQRDGLLVSHEVPVHQVMELKDLAPQALTICVLGANGVGKTSLISAFMGADVTPGTTTEKRIEVDGVVHTLGIMDADFADVDDASCGYISGPHAFLFLFDITSRASFDALKDRLLGLMVAARGHEPTVPVTIVATKSDLAAKRVVSVREALALAQELSTLIKGSVALFEVSSTGGVNVVDSFQDTFLNVLHWRTCDAKNHVNEGGWCLMM